MKTHVHTLEVDTPDLTSGDGKVSSMAQRIEGSEILRIGADIRRLAAEGKRVCNLTVGDFSPSEFRPPVFLREGIAEALKRGETHYPPSDGVLELRKAIQGFYRSQLHLDYPLESILVHSGARPGIYGTYRTLVNPGDAVVFPVPSWNNNHYCNILGALQRPVICTADERFLPTAERLRDAVKGAVLLVLNSPSNPTGTAFSKEALEEICELVLHENKRRGSGERPLYLLYDQVYWLLTFGTTRHCDPVTLRPAIREYTLLIDGISKCFASTGLRVGWTVGPPEIVSKSGSLLAHIGSWAPRPEQVASAATLMRKDIVEEYVHAIRNGVIERLDILHDGIAKMEADGFPVTSIPPMGAIFLSARFNLNGRTTRGGRLLSTNEHIREYLLSEAQVAAVPFHAFGSTEETGWFRLSVGAVSPQDVREMFPRLRKALEGIK
jgi:aspartate aminotransferase